MYHLWTLPVVKEKQGLCLLERLHWPNMSCRVLSLHMMTSHLGTHVVVFLHLYNISLPHTLGWWVFLPSQVVEEGIIFPGAEVWTRAGWLSALAGRCIASGQQPALSPKKVALSHIPKSSLWPGVVFLMLHWLLLQGAADFVFWMQIDKILS